MIKFDVYLKEHKLRRVRAQRSSAFFRVKTARGLEIDHINIIVRKDSAAHTFVLSRPRPAAMRRKRRTAQARRLTHRATTFLRAISPCTAAAFTVTALSL